MTRIGAGIGWGRGKYHPPLGERRKRKKKRITRFYSPFYWSIGSPERHRENFGRPNGNLGDAERGITEGKNEGNLLVEQFDRLNREGKMPNGGKGGEKCRASSMSLDPV